MYKAPNGRARSQDRSVQRAAADFGNDLRAAIATRSLVNGRNRGKMGREGGSERLGGRDLALRDQQLLRRG